MTQNLTVAAVWKDHVHFLKRLGEARIEYEIAIKYDHMYGTYGMFISKYITPYIWIVPLIALSFLLSIFKRVHLFGPTQKYLVTVISIDVFFTMFTGLRDVVFNVMEWNYGIVEYQACWVLICFFKVQFVLHATSLWIMSVMFVHRVLMFLFPFKMRQWRLKMICVPFVTFHFILSMVYCAVLAVAPITPVSMLQEYNPGMPLKEITVCVISKEDEYFTETFHRFMHLLVFVIHGVYFSSLPICINILCTIFLIFFVQKEINKISFFTTNIRLKNVAYLILIKAHILLGVSFILQEIPIYVSFAFATSSKETNAIDIAQAVVLINMFQSFAIGKPIDVIIYACLSRKVNSELKKCFCCNITYKCVIDVLMFTLVQHCKSF